MSDALSVVEAWNRKWRTLWVWSQLYIGYKAAQARGNLLNEEQRRVYWERKHSTLAQHVWSNIAELRGWWVKVGQFLSTRSDILPAQYIKHLTKLQDMMPTSAFPIVRSIIEEEFNAPLESIFSEFEEIAIASASIGQVHKARLHSTGEYVVVKVQHPGVDKVLQQDMNTLTQMSWAFALLEKGLNFAPILEEWQKSAANELDFNLELAFQERARKAALEANLQVIIPRCYPEYTTKRVLVMEYIEGMKITNIEKLKECEIDVNSLMLKLGEAFAYQIHIDGLFNGDPHPGNILVQKQPSGDYWPVLLDWGLVKTFTNSGRLAFSNAVCCIADMNVMGLMEAFEDMGFKFKKGFAIDPEIYMDALRIGFFRDTGEDSVVSSEKQNVTAALSESKVTKEDIMQRNPIDDWPKDIIFFVRVVSLLHGLCLQLNASIPFLKILVAKARQCLMESYIPPSLNIYVQYPEEKMRSYVEWRISKYIHHLYEKMDLILGCQVAVYKNNKLIVDTCVGRMGPTNTKPIAKDSLFCVGTIANAILGSAVLQLVEQKKISLGELLCNWCDGFIRYNKDDITIEDVLTHRTGCHKAFPKDLKLSNLLNYDYMVSLLENTNPILPRTGQYTYLVNGWLLSEIIRNASGMRYDEYIYTNFIKKFNLGNEFFYPVPRETNQNSLKYKIGRSKSTESISKNRLSILKNARRRPTYNILELEVDDILKSAHEKHDKQDLLKFHEILHKKSTSTSIFYQGDKSNSLLKLPSQPEQIVKCCNCINTVNSQPQSSWLINKSMSSNVSNLSGSVRRKSASVERCYVKEETPAKEPRKNLIENLSTTQNDLSSRFVKSRRHIGEPKISDAEVLEKKNQLLGKLNKVNDNSFYSVIKSKYIHKILEPNQKKNLQDEKVTALEFAQIKTHVMDPLIYDSRHLWSALIPSTNCRASARAIAQLFFCIATGKIIGQSLLEKASQVYTVDNSLDTIILNGRTSSLWGLGYQIFPCIHTSNTPIETTVAEVERSVKFNDDKQKPSSFDNNSSVKIIQGIGHADINGSIVLCIPQLELSVCILVNDILTGSIAARKILNFVLNCFGLEPAWHKRLSMSQIISDITYSLESNK